MSLEMLRLIGMLMFVVDCAKHILGLILMLACLRCLGAVTDYCNKKARGNK